MFTHTLDNKRYHTLNYYYQTLFHHKVFKVSLNANFSCPNFQNGGCVFCLHGSNDYDVEKNNDLVTQFYEVAKTLEKKWPNSYYIGYFQANTNTYAPLPILKAKYEKILNLPNVVGLSIATRSDAITKECLDYLDELNKKTFLTIELGLQSSHEKTLQFIKRGHTLENFCDCVKKLKAKNIKIVVHIINGLPFENNTNFYYFVGGFAVNIKLDIQEKTTNLNV